MTVEGSEQARSSAKAVRVLGWLFIVFSPIVSLVIFTGDAEPDVESMVAGGVILISGVVTGMFILMASNFVIAQTEFSRWLLELAIVMAETPTIDCASCNSSVVTDAEFCHFCGKVPFFARCKMCDAGMAFDHKYCNKCGQKKGSPDTG
jgi:hypothetical protein